MLRVKNLLTFHCFTKTCWIPKKVEKKFLKKFLNLFLFGIQKDKMSGVNTKMNEIRKIKVQLSSKIGVYKLI